MNHKQLRAMAALSFLWLAAPQAMVAQGHGDSVAVVGVISEFHAALESGDSLSALALLGEDLVVLESGGVEDRSEYRSHHLAADIRFSAAVPATRTMISVTVQNDVAWVSSASESKGSWRDREVDSIGAELMVLKRTADGWRIVAIHWSSRSR